MRAVTMFNHRRKHGLRKHQRRFDAAAPAVRRPRVRRLAVEAMESRLLLSGNQATDGNLDYSIWNLDSLQTNYAIISQGESLPAPSASTSSAAGPSGNDLDVSWIPVPDMQLSAGDAQSLAHQQFREAMSKGVINSQQSSVLYQQLLSGFSSDMDSTLVPVYTIGIRSHSVTPVVGGLTDVFSDRDSTAFLSNIYGGLIASDSAFSITPPLVITLVSPGSSFGVGPAAFQYNGAAPSLDDDVRSSGDFNRDGLVDAADYRVWRDAAGPSDVLAYNNWKANYGRSVVDLVKVGDLLDKGSLGSLVFDFDGVLDPQPTITIDVTRASDLVTTSGTLTAGFDLTLRSQDDAFAAGTPSISKLGPVGPQGDSLPSSKGTLAHEGLVVTIGPVTIAKSDDADIAASGPTLIVSIDGGSSQRIVSTSPARIETSSPQQSKADQELDQAIDELLAGDPIIVSQSDGASGQAVANATPPESVGVTDVATSDVFSGDSAEPQSQVGDSADAATANQLAEGGMIAIGEIVDAATGDAAPSTDQIADAGDAAELVGELSRVAVMELIEGEAEPGEPESADRVMIVAAADATGPLDTVQVVVQQAGVAFALTSPAGPTSLASLATAAVDAASRAIATLVGNHLAAEAAGELAAADAAFSELGAAEDDAESTAALAGPHWNRWLAATPLVLAIAGERTLAARNKRREERHAVR